MAFKTVELPEIGPVRLYKRKGVRNIRLSITSSGVVRVTLPFWLPYRLGAEFAASKARWIAESKPSSTSLQADDVIGKSHHLTVGGAKGRRITTRVTEDAVHILLPIGVHMEDNAAQIAANRAAIKALKSEAEILLPPRLEKLATTYNFKYRSLTIRQLKGRWGSCSQHTDIVLNCFLMQLPWELVDYVLLHELVHTRIMAHGPKFWDEMSHYVPDLGTVRKAMRVHRPILTVPE